MNEPTQAQKKWVWEQCGLTWGKRKELAYELPHRPIDLNCWLTPTGLAISKKLPIIDLNNLFQYAVPKLKGKYELDVSDDSELLGKSICLHSIVNRGCSVASPIEYFKDWDEFYLALFWAIYKAFGGDNEDS